MNKEYFRVQVGDLVMISPGYWLDGHDGGWDNDLEYLIPVPSEPELCALGDVSELFE